MNLMPWRGGAGNYDVLESAKIVYNNNIIIIINKRLFVFTHLQKQLYDIRRYEYMPKWINISPTIFIWWG